MTGDDDRLRAHRQLSSLLGRADDEAFLLLIWGVNALQTGNSQGGAAAFPFGFPPQVVTEDLGTDWSIYPWELETLANELLASPKGIYRSLACSRWETMAKVVDLLRRIDDLDFSAKAENINIFEELYRLSGRQLDWQRGYFNKPQMYRNIYIYGQGACAEYFSAHYGININELTVVGFGMFANFARRPNFTSDDDFALLGVTPAMRDWALAILAAPLADLRQLAAREREQWGTMAYRPSVLRRFPCIRYGRRGWKIRSPLPALILERITSGLFYDVVPGGGPIRDDYGRRFEEYARRYISEMFPALAVEPESKYRVAGNRLLTPDIIISAQIESKVALAIECKATRMSFGARFADEPAADRGYDDIVKAIFQLWRYFSHCRRGLTGRSLALNAVGLVLTLDSWLVMATEMFNEIFDRAERSANERDPLIEAQDRRPVAFVSILDFERASEIGTAETFVAAVREAAEPSHRGGYLQNRHESIVGKGVVRRDYPFTDLATMLPWWRLVEEAMASEQAATKAAS